MTTVKTADVIVIGSGIVGNSCAYYCAQKGLSVIVLDEDIVGNGGSSRNGGGVRAFFRDPKEMPMAKYAIDNIWPNLSEELGVDIEYKQGGNFRLGIGEAEKEKLEALAQEGNAQGLSVELMDKQRIKEFCPYVSDDVTNAAYCANDGHANPLVTTLAFYRKNKALGVQYYTGEKVIKLGKHKEQIRSVITADGNLYEADHVIAAAGYETRDIVNTVGIDIPMNLYLLEAFVTETTPHLFDFMMGTAGSAFYGHQTKHGSFVFGGGSGFEVFNSGNINVNTTRQITAPSVIRGIMKYFPCLSELKIIRTWAGWTDHTKDGCAVIGPVEEVPGLLLAAGFTGHGFCMGPVVGKVMSELITGTEPCVEYKQLRYDRFTAKQ